MRRLVSMLALVLVPVVAPHGRALAQASALRPVPARQVTLAGGLLGERIATNRRVTIPHCMALCEETKRIANFAVAGKLQEGKHEGYFFNDSDVYKLVEGACLALQAWPDAALRARIDAVVAAIAKAQEPDGYLYTARTLQREGHMPPGGKERWSDLQWGHELYCAGHLYEAAVAHFAATGSKALLDVATKNADLVAATFGPGKDQHPDGHPEVELALVKLAEATGRRQYLDLARFFLDARGKKGGGRALYGEYAQDHAPVREQRIAAGHAVRAEYLYSGMVDVGALTGDRELLAAAAALWQNAIGRKTYLTGGVGSRASGEAFGDDFELPNATAYTETCATIASALLSWRLFLQDGDFARVDVLERCIYNGVLAGLSLSGDRFFYPNPLESLRGAERQRWFACACCPPNVVRFVESIPGFCYATREKELAVCLYAAGTARLEVDGKPVVVVQETDYPFGGTVKLTLAPEGEQEFEVVLRLPGWTREAVLPGALYRFADAAKGEPVLRVCGKPESAVSHRGVLGIRRAWKKGDTIELELPMPARRVLARDEVAADRGKVAVVRGPLVYCAEACDQPDRRVAHLRLPDGAALAAERRADLLGGVTVLRGKAEALRRTLDGKVVAEGERELVLVPYYAWANREKGPMAVWLARDAAAARPLPAPTLAATARLETSGGSDQEAMVDQVEPKSSSDGEVPHFRFADKKGTKERVVLTFAKPARVSEVDVYWFQDEAGGECRVPAACELMVQINGQWHTVEGGRLGCEKDCFNMASFAPALEVEGIRLEIQLQPKLSAGIHELRVR